jgi:hypothetical protein
MRAYSSAWIFVRRDLVVISQPFSHVATFSTAGDPSNSLSQWTMSKIEYGWMGFAGRGGPLVTNACRPPQIHSLKRGWHGAGGQWHRQTTANP